MGNARFDTYDTEEVTHRTFLEAWTRKQVLIKEGYRVKIRKNAEGAYAVLKKHDELFHGQSWRKMNNGGRSSRTSR